MAHSHLNGAHTHTDGGGVIGQAAVLVAVIAAAAITIEVVTWLLHILVIIATGTGFAVLGAATGYGWLKWRHLKHRREAWPQQVYRPGVARSFSARQAGPAPALPRGGDIHLHLPPGITATDVAEIMHEHAGQR